MQTIGERLEEARKRKGISIREAADATKIRGEYLHKFEGNQFDIGLPEIYVRGFLRTYAGFLKLPADKITADYQALGHGQDPRARGARLPSRELYGRMEISASSAPAGADAARPASAKAPAEAGEPGGGETTFRQSLTRAPISPEVLLKYAIWGGGALLVIVLIYAGVTLLTGRSSSTPVEGTASPTPATSPATSPATPAAQQIVLVALDRVEAKVVQESDGTVLFEGSLQRGERRPLTRRGSVLITARNGKDLELEVNGQRLKLGFEGYDRVRLGQ